MYSRQWKKAPIEISALLVYNMKHAKSVLTHSCPYDARKVQNIYFT